MPLDYTKPETLADVLSALTGGSPDDTVRHRARVSAVHRIADFLHRPPSDIPCEVKVLRCQLEDLHPATCGVSGKTLSNIKSNLSDALRETGVLPDDEARPVRSAAWTAFLDKAEDPQRWGLSRFVNYCSARNIEPDTVNQDDFDDYQGFLDTRLLARSPDQHCKAVAGTWNHLVKKNGLSFVQFETVRRKRYVARPLTEYPKSLQDDISVYLARLTHEDIFSEEGPDKPLRPTSIRNIRAHLAQYIDALLSAGLPTSDLTSLRVAITSDNIKIAFREILKRRSDKSVPVGLANIAATLAAICRHHLKMQSGDLKAILDLKKKVSANPRGMSSKNAERLAQFNDWENVVRLVALPSILMNRANGIPVGRTSAIEAMHAAALAVLLSCPVRMANLAGLDLDRHLRPSKRGSHTIYGIRIEGTEVKNGEPIEVVLNAKMSALLHRYIIQFRPQVSEIKGTALFPRPSDGKPREPHNLSSELVSRIKRETGLKVHPHLFRHLAAMLYLKERPGDFETVRRLLKHKRLQTTMDFYANLSSQWAHDHYDKVVLAKFGGGNG
ncbi:site-specific integrase [Kordiimonas sp.]|uniref:site-specific integrase n=1 Tax=Kordiimonas sp. TaxID=1970157 RepID=UPI003A90163C